MTFLDDALKSMAAVKPGRAVLLVLASPFWLVGATAGLVVWTARFVAAVVAVGFTATASMGGDR